MALKKMYRCRLTNRQDSSRPGFVRVKTMRRDMIKDVGIRVLSADLC